MLIELKGKRMTSKRRGGDLFIVDNSVSGWTGLRYLQEWFLTLTFREPVSLDTARRQLLHWNRDLCTSEGIQTAFIAVWNNTNFTSHWHALIFGKNKNGRTLLDVLEKRWERKWPGIARIEVVRGNQAASHYVAGNITLWNPDQYELLVYNKKLLNKYRLPRQD